MRNSGVRIASIAFSLSVFINGCGASSDSALENVFNIDNRELVTTADHPWSAVGRLETGCTGTLVGKRLVLTAAHCLFSGNGQINPRLGEFKPNLVNNQTPETYWVDQMWFGTDKPDNDRGKDWAILRLSKNAMDRFSFLEVEDDGASGRLPYTTNLVGYSRDKNNGQTASVHRGCYVHEIVGDRMLHDCDGTTGVSGGPLYATSSGKAKIVGITVSEFRGSSPTSLFVDQYRRDQSNVAISASVFSQTLKRLLTTADLGQDPGEISGVMAMANPNRLLGPITGPFSEPPTKTAIETRAVAIQRAAALIGAKSQDVQNEVRRYVFDHQMIGLAADIALSAKAIGSLARDVEHFRVALETDPSDLHRFFSDLWVAKADFRSRVAKLRGQGIQFDEVMMLELVGLIDELTGVVYR